MGTKNGKIEKISVVDQVCDALKQRILAGELTPGDKLPSESDIAEYYGVNRLSVRMALQKLITLGVVETRVGEGSYVKEVSVTPVLQELSSYLMGDKSMNEIEEVRYILERFSALAAAERADEESIETLKEIAARFCDAFDAFSAEDTGENAENYIQADFELHRQIIRMSGNSLLEELYHIIHELVHIHMEQMIRERRTNRELDSRDYKEMHMQLCDAICSHDRARTKATLTDLLLHDSAAARITD